MTHERSVTWYLEHKTDFIPVDVRTPAEFTDSHIPGAVNIPLFTNEERAEVGTIYKQIGKKEAKWRAMEIVAPKLPQLLADIKKLQSSGKQPLLYCWRGGMRSQSVYQLANMAGLDIDRLEGGYRAYRQAILEKIPVLIPDQAIVIDGMTGTGKTEILHALKKLGHPVLDLEKYARHKGSVFGAIDGHIPHNQKMFDALLFEDLHNMEGASYFFMEGESKRIGHAVQPPELYEKKMNGIHIMVTASLETRIERIYRDYVACRAEADADAFQERVSFALKKILKRIRPQEIQKELLSRLEERDYREIIRLLIEYYYDPRYENKGNEIGRIDYTFSSESITEAAENISALVTSLHKKQRLSS